MNKKQIGILIIFLTFTSFVSANDWTFENTQKTFGACVNTGVSAGASRAYMRIKCNCFVKYLKRAVPRYADVIALNKATAGGYLTYEQRTIKSSALRACNR